jgi:23S rRNA (cytidine1920-2'-O)/16S rRNA (cytidine1409-2'-O)-methyltransferase
LTWVSRAALKLVGGLDAFPQIDPTDRICVDIGASTGGFSEVLLTRGARHVVAVDVGRNQLHPRLAGDPRVVSRQGVNARHLVAADFALPPELVVCDASFISLTKVLPPVLDLAAPGAGLLALVKPQFEVGRAAIGKGGIVRDHAAAEDALARVTDWLVTEAGWHLIGTAPSPIDGHDGNREFLLAGRKG